MSAFKQFLAKDIKLVPFTVNKQFSFENSQFYADESEYHTYKQFVGIERFLGTNLSGSLFETATDPTTGHSQSLYQRQVYDSVKELYYSNYISSSWGDPGTAIQREEISGSYNTPSYYNYLSSTLTASRHFPTASNAQLSVVSIPSKLFGEYIQPTSFKFEYQDTSSARLTVLDDGEGNLYSSASYSFYSASVSTITTSSQFVQLATEIDPILLPGGFQELIYSGTTIPSGYTLIEVDYSPSGRSPFYIGGIGNNAGYITSSLQGADIGKFIVQEFLMEAGDPGNLGFFTSSLSPQVGDTITFTYTSESFHGSGSIVANENVGNIIYEHGMAVLTNTNLPHRNLANAYNVTASFLSSTTILESEYKCAIRENEFNFSTNPSITSGSIAISSSIGTFNSAGETLYNYATGSYFSPYITTVGLYDNFQNLLAVGKLAQPLQSSNTTDTTIIINLDL
tara:strand:- start:398 stop:1759 length:1362 start_codon:yes stop_codon:yes gene_type:complete